MSEWKKVPLDKMGVVSRGKSKHRPRNDARLFGGRYPFIQTGDIGAAGLYVQDYSQTYNEEGLAQSKLWPKDTLCVTIAANIADTALLAFPACFPDSIMGFVPYENVSNVKYVKYCFDILKKDCQQISQGTAQDNLSWKKLSTILFPCPPIEVQNRIVDILSRYDSLIESYQKQIKLLEEAAQRLYKEWFVDLHFPGHENAKIVDGVPEGWEKKRIGDIVEYFDKQRKPLSSMQRMSMDKIYPYYGAATLMDYVDNYLFDGIYLLLGEDGTVITPENYPVLQYVWGKFWVNNHAHVLRGKDGISTEFLYAMFNEMPIADVVTGAAQPKISQGRLSEKKVLIPPIQLILKWSDITKAYFDSYRNLSDKIRLLTEARDRLLPKLMSGEIAV